MFSFNKMIPLLPKESKSLGMIDSIVKKYPNGINVWGDITNALYVKFLYLEFNDLFALYEMINAENWAAKEADKKEVLSELEDGLLETFHKIDMPSLRKLSDSQLTMLFKIKTHFMGTILHAASGFLFKKDVLEKFDVLLKHPLAKEIINYKDTCNGHHYTPLIRLFVELRQNSDTLMEKDQLLEKVLILNTLISKYVELGAKNFDTEPFKDLNFILKSSSSLPYIAQLMHAVATWGNTYDPNKDDAESDKIYMMVNQILQYQHSTKEYAPLAVCALRDAIHDPRLKKEEAKAQWDQQKKDWEAEKLKFAEKLKKEHKLESFEAKKEAKLAFGLWDEAAPVQQAPAPTESKKDETINAKPGRWRDRD